ncbi:hypothetical protein F4X88_17900 [Candidatus Poribacteria bacterium]|nr:hypothetical protein [Candidatus Poribacteria bacterium]MYA58161.1 hypothetical protein [Candidatus Poribacteria bacterium]
MCIILDTNTFGKFRNPNDEDMAPVWKWLDNRNGKIVYANTKKFEDEWERGGMNHLRDQMMWAGQLKLVSGGVQEKADELEGKIVSDDPHIIALALIAELKVLVSYREGDGDLFTDFKNRQLVGGRVYTRKSHEHMLTRDTCP